MVHFGLSGLREMFRFTGSIFYFQKESLEIIKLNITTKDTYIYCQTDNETFDICKICKRNMVKKLTQKECYI